LTSPRKIPSFPESISTEPMIPIALKLALDRYRSLLCDLETAESSLSADRALALLYARDALQKTLNRGESLPSPYVLEILELDKQLQQYAYKIIAAIDLEKYRQTLPVMPTQWWWHLETSGDPHPHDRHDWVWKSGTIVFWTLSLGFLTDIVTRFVSGGVGAFGASVVALPTLLTLLKAKSDLTETGEKAVEKLIRNAAKAIAGRDIPSHWHEELKCGATVIFSGAIFGLWLSLPIFSQLYDRWGVANYLDGELGSAERDYQQAIALNADNAKAHFHLANLYEDLQEYDEAETHYRLALGELPEAYNNLGRLLIIQENYSEAVALLERGLIKVREENSLPQVRYSLLKNLGWARFEQGRDREAEPTLRAAIGIASHPDTTDKITNQGAAYCLLAQVLDRQEQPNSVEMWLQCCRLGSRLNPDDDEWLHLAHQKLEATGQTCTTTTP